jgi:hypothetical protein
MALGANSRYRAAPAKAALQKRIRESFFRPDGRAIHDPGF